MNSPENSLTQNPNESLAADLQDSSRVRAWFDQAMEMARSRFNIPPSVYRLQFNKDFTFVDACRTLPYLQKLGISSIYSSPYFEAVSGSPHGYNITDPNKLNPEVGTDEQYQTLCQQLRQFGMGQILDVVPNHMGISSQNKLWMDVLENGESSFYAKFFDIDWNPENQKLHKKILIPILAGNYGDVIEGQNIKLGFSNGEFTLWYKQMPLPIAPKTYPIILETLLSDLEKSLPTDNEYYLELLSIITAFKNLPDRTRQDTRAKAERNREKEIAKNRLGALAGDSVEISKFIDTTLAAFNGQPDNPQSFDRLDMLLSKQPYRLAFWNVASEEINYRRFFDINDLAAIRIEDKEVFDFHHEFVFRLVTEGKVQGIRIDHPDGLYDPPDYFRRLQVRYVRDLIVRAIVPGLENVEGALDVLENKIRDIFKTLPDSETYPLYVVVEKILDRNEDLPPNWLVHGTVGYDFLNTLNGIFVDQKNEKVLSDFYQDYIRHSVNFDSIVYEKKKFFALVHMASEIGNLGRLLHSIAQKNRHYQDFTRNNLTLGIREVIACFPVYRTYIGPKATTVSDQDRRAIQDAVRSAKKKTIGLNPNIYDYLEKIMLLKLPTFSDVEERQYRDFILRFQQLTGPIMAKGLEDTVFYVNNRLLVLNEVGGDPGVFGNSVEEFHRKNQKRLTHWPGSFLTTSTHDTKRSEDVRARLAVISEIPDQWQSAVKNWTELTSSFKTKVNSHFFPDPNLEYFIYQTLLGVWPFSLKPENKKSFFDRIWAYVHKSVREAKVFSNWTNPNHEYEDAVREFLENLILGEKGQPFREAFDPLRRQISLLGQYNSLSSLVLKGASPGVMDTYQGNEVWDFSLVDPDNRRPVKFGNHLSLWDEVSSRRIENKNWNHGEALWGESASGTIKIHVLTEILKTRRDFKDLFIFGEYLPLKVEGPLADHVIAFSRIRNDQAALIVSCRFFDKLTRSGKIRPMGTNVWGKTRVYLPEIFYKLKSVDIFSERSLDVVREGSTTYVDLGSLLISNPFAFTINR